MKLKRTILGIASIIALLSAAAGRSQDYWAEPQYGDVNATMVPSYEGEMVDDGGTAAGGGLLGSVLGGGSAGGRGLLGSHPWLHPEMLLWWSQTRYVPALVTTSPTGTGQALAGRLDQPETSILFGDERVGGDLDVGFRISGGTWLDDSLTLGVGVRYFTVGNDDDFSTSSGGDPILARPFFNVSSGQEDALLVAFPGLSTGSVNMKASNKAEGLDLYLRRLLHAGYCNRLDIIGGYHTSKITDKVTAADSLVSQDPVGRVPVGTMIDTSDLFRVENKFNGGFVGLMTQADDGRLTWRMMSKIAFGEMQQEASARGSTTTTVPGVAPSTANYGLLALNSNSMTIQRDDFAVVPEVSLSIGYKLTSNLELTVGYSFIYWSKVALAGDLIDLNVNPTQIGGPLVGPAAPTLGLQDDGFWYQGLDLGLFMQF